MGSVGMLSATENPQEHFGQPQPDPEPGQSLVEPSHNNQTETKDIIDAPFSSSNILASSLAQNEEQTENLKSINSLETLGTDSSAMELEPSQEEFNNHSDLVNNMTSKLIKAELIHESQEEPQSTILLRALESNRKKEISTEVLPEDGNQSIMDVELANDFEPVPDTPNESIDDKSSLLDRLGPALQSEDTRLSFADNSDALLPPPESTALRPSSASCPPSVNQKIDDDSLESKASVVSTQSTSSRKRKQTSDCLVVGSSMTTRSKSNDSSFKTVNVSFPAEKLYEYQWPKDSGEHYMLQEQVSEFLGIKSFKRKYPDLERRTVEIEEKRFLKDQGVVSETQCDLGLIAIKVDDMMDLMSKDYPAKYADYMKALDRKKEANYVAKTVNISKPPSGNVEKNKISEMIKKAIKSATQYNAELNQVRREERQVSMDLQTYTLHYPIGLGRDNKTLKRNIASGKIPKIGKYPIATIHGQYQDWYIKYTSEELKYFPINSVLYGPIMPNSSKEATATKKPGEEGNGDDPQSGSDSLSDGSDFSDDSCCSQQNSNDKSRRENGDGAGDEDGISCDSCSSSQSSCSDDENDTKPDTVNSNSESKRSEPLCKMCKGSAQGNKQNVPEELVHCADCANSVHPSCLQLTTDMIDVIKSYAWQCTDCKTCVHCNKPYNEDKLMFCDMCDRGYHTFCVGLRVIPTGKWVCKLCAQCAQCGTNTPGEGSKVNWHHETIKIKSPNGETLRRHQLLCLTCYKQRKMR